MRAPHQAQARFDHAHAAWDALLKHVRLISGGNASQVDYRGFAANRALLADYLNALSAVTPAEYAAWSKSQQFAFLANAYDAFTVEKILTRYPNLESIRDFGGIFGNPWKDEFFTLLGARRSLDWIEHDTNAAPTVRREAAACSREYPAATTAATAPATSSTRCGDPVGER